MSKDKIQRKSKLMTERKLKFNSCWVLKFRQRIKDSTQVLVKICRDKEENSLVVVKYDPDNLYSIQVENIYPTIIENEFKPVLKAIISPNCHTFPDQFLI